MLKALIESAVEPRSIVENILTVTEVTTSSSVGGDAFIQHRYKFVNPLDIPLYCSIVYDGDPEAINRCKEELESHFK